MRPSRRIVKGREIWIVGSEMQLSIGGDGQLTSRSFKSHVDSGLRDDALEKPDRATRAYTQADGAMRLHSRRE